MLGVRNSSISESPRPLNSNELCFPYHPLPPSTPSAISSHTWQTTLCHGIDLIDLNLARLKGVVPCALHTAAGSIEKSLAGALQEPTRKFQRVLSFGHQDVNTMTSLWSTDLARGKPLHFMHTYVRFMHMIDPAHCTTSGAR